MTSALRAAGLRVFLMTSAVLLASARGAAAANYSVTTNADSGPGSLRALLGANGGSNTYSWAAGSGGTLVLASALSVGSNTTLDATGAPSAVAITGSAVNLSGATTFSNGNTVQTWSVAAPINGSGWLIKTGAGRLDLTGANGYTGGTIVNAGVLSVNSDSALGHTSGSLTFNGGALQTTSAFSSARSVILNGNGAFDTSGGDLALTGTVTGAGALVKTGTGILSLRETNSYTGGTTLVQGTLGIADFSALGSGGVTFNGGALQLQTSLDSARTFILNAGGGTFDTAGGTSTLSGLISGTGGLTKTATGTLVLSGDNTYVGGTTVTGGVLSVSRDSNLGDANGGIVLDGGSLRTLSSITTSRSVTLGAGGGTIDTDGYDSTFSGAFTGAGGLLKTGAGILTLGGAGTYSGGTTVSVGGLKYGVDDALPANGALTVASGAKVDLAGYSQHATLGVVINNGTLDAGSGALTLNNGYQGTGVLAIALTPGTTNITGTGLNLNGGTLSARLRDPHVVSGQSFTAISGAGITGTFSNVTSPAALDFAPTYSSTGVTLTVRFVPLGSLGANPNQAAVGAALEPARANPTGDLATVIGGLYNLDKTGLQSALDQIGPIPLQAMAGLSRASADAYSAAIERRTTALTEDFAPDALGSSYFVSPLTTRGSLSGRTNDQGTQPGYSLTSAGVALGVDRRLGAGLAAGVSCGYLHGRSTIGSTAPGAVDDDQLRAGLYAAGAADDFHADLYVGAAQDFYSTARGIAYDTVSRTASASPRGDQISAGGRFGWDMKAAEGQVFFSPYFGLAYDRVRISPFNEHGADALDLSVGPQTSRSLRSDIGLRYSEHRRTEIGFLTTYLSAGWRHEYTSQDRAIGAHLASGDGAPFFVSTGDVGRNGTLLGGGLSVGVSAATTLALDYTGDFRPTFSAQTLDATVKVLF